MSVPCLDEDAITDLLAGRLHLDSELEEHLTQCALCPRLLGAATLTERATKPLVPSTGGSPSVAGTNGAPSAAGWKRPSRNRPALEPGIVLNDTYAISRLIGRGGMGEVYEVSHARLSGRYAVKVLRAEISDDEGLLSRFRREAVISSSLRHPHIIQVFDFDRTPDGCVYLAMEYLDGRDLAQLLQSEGALSVDRTLFILAQVSSALTAAHRRGVVHRDLKPENIFIVRDEGEPHERIKLMDFGLSKWSSAAVDSSISLSRDQALIGTPRYMAPEQALGHNQELTAATDQFALAAIVYEMLGGTPAFAGNTLAQLLHSIVYERPSLETLRKRGVPQGLCDALSKGLAKLPQDRFESVQDFHRAVSLSAATEVSTQAGRPPLRTIGLLGLVATAVVLASGGGFTAWNSARRPRVANISRAVVAAVVDAGAVMMAEEPSDARTLQGDGGSPVPSGQVAPPEVAPVRTRAVRPRRAQAVPNAVSSPAITSRSAADPVEPKRVPDDMAANPAAKVDGRASGVEIIKEF
ncbi:MAG: serine/threonine-protein kinase [Polyangia bacterium]